LSHQRKAKKCFRPAKQLGRATPIFGRHDVVQAIELADALEAAVIDAAGRESIALRVLLRYWGGPARSVSLAAVVDVGHHDITRLIETEKDAPFAHT
jgi:hypothetical protein